MTTFTQEQLDSYLTLDDLEKLKFCLDSSGNVCVRVYITGGGGGSGDVTGPESSDDNAIARFNLETGKLIQNSTVTLDDSGNLNNVNGIQLDTTPVADSFSTGKIRWNSTDGTAELDTDVSGVTIQLGQETVIRVLNKTGSTITNGSVVYINGAQGNRPTIAKVGNTDFVNGENVIGVVTADILDNAEGYLTTQGLVRDLNTNSYSVGNTLWLGSTAGTFTNTEPSASSLIIRVGEVIVAHPTQGVISVHIENPLTSTVLKNMGAITTEWTGFFDNSNIDVSGDSSTRVVTLTRTGGIGYYHSGKRFSQTSPYALPAHGNVTSNIYYCSFDSTGTFSWSTSPFNFATQGQVVVARYDSVLGTWVYTRETHGLVMDWSTHEDLHNTVGTWHKSGGALTAGTYTTQPVSPADADNTPGVDSAIIVDEDLSTTVNAWTQGTYTTLRFVSSVATFDTGATLPFRVTGTYPNINTGGASEAETVTGRFFNVYAVLTPSASDVQSQKYRVLWVQPQTAYTTSAAAQAEQFNTLNLGNLGSTFQEYVPVRRITYATSASYTGANGRCRIDAVTIPGTTRAASSVSSLDPSKLPLDGGSMNGAINESKGANISSATTTDIGAATGNFVDVTGTTTITGLGTVQAGTRRIVRFTGALTLTHNATSLILPTGANITTAAGDTATFVSLGSGNWVCTSYQRKDGTALVSSGGGFLETSIADYQGPAIIGLLGRYTATRSGTLGSIRLVSDSLPVGSNAVAELRKNSPTGSNIATGSGGMSITTTESPTNGQYIGQIVSGFTVSSFVAGDVFYVYLTGVGSTTPASNVRALLYTT